MGAQYVVILVDADAQDHRRSFVATPMRGNNTKGTGSMEGDARVTTYHPLRAVLTAIIDDAKSFGVGKSCYANFE